MIIGYRNKEPKKQLQEHDVPHKPFPTTYPPNYSDIYLAGVVRPGPRGSPGNLCSGPSTSKRNSSLPKLCAAYRDFHDGPGGTTAEGTVTPIIAQNSSTAFRNRCLSSSPINVDHFFIIEVLRKFLAKAMTVPTDGRDTGRCECRRYFLCISDRDLLCRTFVTSNPKVHVPWSLETNLSLDLPWTSRIPVGYGGYQTSITCCVDMDCLPPRRDMDEAL